MGKIQLPITNYQLPITNALFPMPYAQFLSFVKVPNAIVIWLRLECYDAVKTFQR